MFSVLLLELQDIFHLHQTIYKIPRMHFSAVEILLSAYMPFTWIVFPTSWLHCLGTTDLIPLQLKSEVCPRLSRMERLLLKSVWDPLMDTSHILPTKLSHFPYRDLGSDTGPGNSWGDLAVTLKKRKAERPAACWGCHEECEWSLKQNKYEESEWSLKQDEH